MKIIALATVHNRKQSTLQSISSLREQNLSDEIDLDIVIVDDGSTDGTKTAISDRFPAVKILDGNGTLFWAGGMRFGWKRYVSEQHFDALLVFNDDVVLYPDALQLIVDTFKRKQKSCPMLAVSGATIDPGTDVCSYGGVVRRSRWHPFRFRRIAPNGRIQNLSTLNMNFALISHEALSEIGFFREYFCHSLADYDFGLRLSKHGGQVILSPDYIGTCKRNSWKGTSKERGISIAERFKRFHSTKEQPFEVRLSFYKEHGGMLWPLFWCASYFSIATRR